MIPTSTSPVATDTTIRIEVEASDETGVTDSLAALRTGGWTPVRGPVEKGGDVVCAPEKIVLTYVEGGGTVSVALDMTPPAGLDMPMMMLAAIPTLATEVGASWSASLADDGHWTVTLTLTRTGARDASVVSLSDWKKTRGRCGP